MSTLKDFAPLLIATLALAISGYNFYVQQFRKRDKLIGHLISHFVNNGEFNLLAEYSVANIGDTQLLIKGIKVWVSEGPVFLEIKSSCKNIPSILKPGEIAVFGVMYNQEAINECLSDGERCSINFEILSPKGICYRLPHHFNDKGVNQKLIWNVFRLEKKHAS